MPESSPEAEGIGPEDLADAVFAAWYAERARVPRPEPGLTPGPVTFEQFEYRTPEKFELYDGYLFGPGADRWSRARRTDSLALLLTNTGLEDAVRLAPRERWLAALRRVYGDDPGPAGEPGPRRGA